MKKTFIILFLCGCLLTTVKAETSITQLLSSDDWRDREKAISLINKNFDQYKHNDIVKQAVLCALIEENDAIKYLRANKSVRPAEVGRGEGRGEYYLSVLKLVIKLDILNATEALLDSASLGNGVQEAIAERLVEEGKEDVTVLLSLKEKVESPDIFYKGNRSAYLRIINKYLNKEELINENKKTIVRDIVFNGLLLEDRFAKKYAIRCSKYFPEDNQIIEELRKIAVTDTYTQPKEGLTTFPLREEALKVLEKFQKTTP
jgi:hypothetical protein